MSEGGPLAGMRSNGVWLKEKKDGNGESLSLHVDECWEKG